MVIYSVSADFDNFDSCLIDYEACAKVHPGKHYEFLIQLDGTPQKDTWWPRKMVRDNDLPLGDYISKLSSDVMIMQRKAIKQLASIMGNIEILPLDCDFGDYWAINILDVLDCIDYEKSEFVRFPATTGPNPRIMKFLQFAFLPEKIQGHHVFKIVDQPKSHIFVDDVFVEEVRKNSITGFEFIPVWEG